MPTSVTYEGPDLHAHHFRPSESSTDPNSDRLEFAVQINNCMKDAAYHDAHHGHNCQCLKLFISYTPVKARGSAPLKIMKMWVCPTCRAMVYASPFSRKRHHDIHFRPLLPEDEGFHCPEEGCEYWAPVAQRLNFENHLRDQHQIGEPLVCGALYLSDEKTTLFACNKTVTASWRLHDHRVGVHGKLGGEAPHARYGIAKDIENLAQVHWLPEEAFMANEYLVRATDVDIKALLPRKKLSGAKAREQDNCCLQQTPHAGPATSSTSPTPSLISPSSTASSSSSSSPSSGPSTPSISFAGVGPWLMPPASTSHSSSMAVRSSPSKTSRRASPYPLPTHAPRRAEAPTYSTCRRCVSPTHNFSSHRSTPLPMPFHSPYGDSKAPLPSPADEDTLCQQCQRDADQERAVARRLAISSLLCS